MLVDKEAILPQHQIVPLGSGKIGAAGKVKLVQDLFQNVVKEEWVFQVVTTQDS